MAIKRWLLFHTKTSVFVIVFVAYQEHPQQQHQQDMHGCLCVTGTCGSTTAVGSAASGGTGSGVVGVLGLPGGVNLCLAVHGGDPPCDPTGSPLSIGASTLICKINKILINFFFQHEKTGVLSHKCDNDHSYRAWK